MHQKKIAESLHPLERSVLPFVSEKTPLADIVKITGKKEIEVVRALQWLENKSLVALQKNEKDIVLLDKNGILYLENGLPERRFLESIKKEPLSIKEVMKVTGLESDELNSSMGILIGKAAVLVEKGKVRINDNGLRMLGKEMLEEKFLKKLGKGLAKSDIKDEIKFAYDNLAKRKGVIQTRTVKTFTASVTPLGSKIASIKVDKEFMDTLTSSMIKDCSFRGKEFRRYDVSINVPKVNSGRKHFVSQAIRYIRQIWLELGFKEMEGSNVQTSFWDLDALFVPQDHPARDMQDTFYIKDPKYGKLPKKFEERVKQVHENGGDTGSRGWGYKWDPHIAKENLLRTHTTVLSARKISELRMEDLPAKFFSVKKVYRNENLGWKSLFEFIQVEGIVIDPDANFKHLKGYLKNFFAKMGFPDVRLRPGHFPYTEPSVEVDVFHPEKKQWIEFGGSGIFRPEMTKPLLGEEVPVLAWGLGMERTIMQYYGITDIRDLYKNDIKQLREIPFWMR